MADPRVMMSVYTSGLQDPRTVSTLPDTRAFFLHLKSSCIGILFFPHLFSNLAPILFTFFIVSPHGPRLLTRSNGMLVKSGNSGQDMDESYACWSRC